MGRDRRTSTTAIARTGGTIGVLAAAVALAGAGALAYGATVGVRDFRVRVESLPVLPPGSRPVAILQLADLHMAPWQRDKIRFVRELALFEPDLVINTGDSLGHPGGIAPLMQALEPFDGTPGVFVHGSNDYYGPQPKNPLRYFGGPSRKASEPTHLDTRRLEAEYRAMGWLDLNNLARAYEIKGNRLEFFGVDDPHIKRDRLGQLTGAIEDMRENVGWTNDEGGPESVSIGVTHAPYRRVLDMFTTFGASVIFAGHTHGGQIRWPGRPAIVTNCDIPREQAGRLSRWTHAGRTAWLNVSEGLGTSIFAPVRLGAWPEAVLVNLTPRAE